MKILFFAVLFLSTSAQSKLINSKFILENNQAQQVYQALENIKGQVCNESSCSLGVRASTCTIWDGFMFGGGAQSDAECKLNFFNDKIIVRDDQNTKKLFYTFLEMGIAPECWAGECTIEFNNLTCAKKDALAKCAVDLIEYRQD